MSQPQLKGWVIKDASFVTRGSDPTHVQKYILTSERGGWLEVMEFFGDWSVTNIIGERTQRFTREQVDNLLNTLGAPTTAELVDLVDAAKAEYYYDRHFGG
jgi:hypothetical protein